MAEQSKESIFRKESLERVNSPEELHDYIKVTGPGVWMILSAIVVLLTGFIVWGIFGWVESSVPASVEVKDGQTMCYLSSQSAGEIEIGMPVRVTGSRGSVSTVPVKEENTGAVSSRVLQILGLGQTDSVWVMQVDLDGLEDGVYKAEIVTERIRPIKFVTQ